MGLGELSTVRESPWILIESIESLIVIGESVGGASLVAVVGVLIMFSNTGDIGVD
jgi:hypothetical protein